MSNRLAKLYGEVKAPRTDQPKLKPAVTTTPLDVGNPTEAETVQYVEHLIRFQMNWVQASRAMYGHHLSLSEADKIGRKIKRRPAFRAELRRQLQEAADQGTATDKLRVLQYLGARINFDPIDLFDYRFVEEEGGQEIVEDEDGNEMVVPRIRRRLFMKDLNDVPAPARKCIKKIEVFADGACKMEFLDGMPAAQVLARMHGLDGGDSGDAADVLLRLMRERDEQMRRELAKNHSRDDDDEIVVNP